MTLIQALLLVFAYLLGSVPFGLLIARAHGIDLRSVGSGNIGATNVSRALGRKWAYVCFALDVGKGLVPMLLAGRLGVAAEQPATQELFFWMLVGAAAVCGHIFPVYLRFKGGKGVATSVGALIGLAPMTAAIGLLTWALVFAAKRYVSLASIVAAIMTAGAVWIFDAQTGPFLPCVVTALCALVIWRHKSNIRRLLRGTENRFEFKKK